MGVSVRTANTTHLVSQAICAPFPGGVVGTHIQIIRDKDRSKCIDKAREYSRLLIKQGNTVAPVGPPEFDEEQGVWFIDMSFSKRRCCGGATPGSV